MNWNLADSAIPPSYSLDKPKYVVIVKINGYLLSGLAASFALLMGGWMRIDPLQEIDILEGEVASYSIAGPRAAGGSSFKTIWVKVSNGATTSFTTDENQFVIIGQCVEVKHFRRIYSNLNEYAFHRFC